jgi:signal transduction histidine kinase
VNAVIAIASDFAASPYGRARRVLQRTWEALTWRRIGAVLLLCLILSTQILAQANVFDQWSIEHIVEGWAFFFAETAAAGLAMLGAFALAEGAVASDGLHRAIVVGIALPVGAAVGYWLALELLYPAGLSLSFLHFGGDTLRHAAVGCAVAFIYMLRRRAEAAARSMHETEVARQDLAKQMAEARLQLMEAQIEPHFLFNSLANVQRLFETAPESGERLLENLKVYLRAALPQMRGTGSTLAGEAELARAYLEVLGARMGARLRFAVDVPADLADHAFPPMMLITLVENAVKHGIHPSPDGGTVRVQARGHGARLIVEVADTGAGFTGSFGKGVGLANIRARLTALFGEAAELSLHGNEPSGVVASIAVPFS